MPVARRTRQRFSPALAELLEIRGWTQRDLARAVEVDPAHICRLLGRDARPVTRDLLVRIATVLDVGPGYFLEYRQRRLTPA